MTLPSKIGSQSNVTHQWGIINGFAGVFADADLELLRSNPNVASIEEDGYVHAQDVVTQTDATWGLGRISSQTSPADKDPNGLTYTYKYDPPTGAGTDVYIIDAGILITHVIRLIFDSLGHALIASFYSQPSEAAPPGELLCTWLFVDISKTFNPNLLLCSGGYPDVDGTGHGTHCAGTAVSHQYGVAKAAHVIAVRVLGDDGKGTWSDVISGMDWVAKAAATSGRPSVASMSLRGGFNSSANTAANNLVASGVTTVAAAGNDGADAAKFSPGSASSVTTVGASDINDAKASSSNYGAVLAIWAPGTSRRYLYLERRQNQNPIRDFRGYPFVAGFAAYLFGMDSTLTPANVKSIIQSRALKKVLSDIPDGTINALLNNGL
ncbi:subtilisin-like protein [Thelephora ganbajun]|uniref:Subtilisin-like protein n=1 Tax=Thelephora ganbajun TaxID=370292 RepID=A0ACB6ZJ15_THEGA|nr:subtilisin-like protein [Thelephora ganbajun]